MAPFLLTFVSLASMATAFTLHPSSTATSMATTVCRHPTKLFESDDWENEEPPEMSNLEKFLEQQYSTYHSVFVKENAAILKLVQSGDPVTIFALNNKFFETELGEKEMAQLVDPRNLETTEKMGAYHIVADEAVSATRLFQEDWTKPRTPKGNPELSFAGISTLGGEVAVSRSKSGGFLGLFKEEDGGVVLGTQAKIVKSYVVAGNSVVHEVDSLVSPPVLWRYFDQLRIPGF